MENRTLSFSIFRFNPATPEIKPRMQDFQLDETPNMTVSIALNRLREEQDPSLMFDFVCRAAICGSCAMLINGRPQLACKTLTIRTAGKYSPDASAGFQTGWRSS